MCTLELSQERMSEIALKVKKNSPANLVAGDSSSTSRSGVQHGTTEIVILLSTTTHGTRDPDEKK